ncbi:hypothetical protein TRFO_20543 [Tritrichomonas foetus]|uniref:Myb-like DNA-binding domain containing protein n=1 Tax=Tritrichomonas foetus TaxID=1144522 RepID=A0A1J4KFP5_9EUKA|nr:hypothetical protein TRFO_20543 [Tritrichomonas foetus]|eukprot:OHT10239.1 hypothetical protein TRFO_20543 [Tritrichomonas foetus]
MSATNNRKHTIARRPFTVEEDARLIEIMNSAEFINWEVVAQKMGGRSSRQCRERWVNYLSPGIRTDPWTEMEDRLLIQKMNELGRCWSTIGQFFNGRSENDVKNRWYSHLKYISIERAGRIQIVSDPSLCPFPERKKRRRTKVCPQQNALRILEQMKTSTNNVDDHIVPQKVEDVKPEVIVEPKIAQTIPSFPTFSSTATSSYMPQNIAPAPTFAQQTVQLTFEDQPDEQKPEIFDFWDSSLLDDYADAKFEREFMQLASTSFPFASFT